MPTDAPSQTRQLTVSRPSRAVTAAAAELVVPGIIADAGENAARRFLEFFAAVIRNRNTRAAYMTAVSRFFAWCEQHRIGLSSPISSRCTLQPTSRISAGISRSRR